jgi:endonuclease-3
MNKKISFILETLNELFPNPEIPLEHTSAYTLLIATLLSAQCTDKRVNEVTRILFRKANTPEEMVKLSVEEIEEIIRPCGLGPKKSKAIHGLSQILIERHGGLVPNTFEALEKLPGVGHKTASVVMIQAFEISAFPVDTHIHRLAKRWGLSSGKTVEETEKDLKKAFPQKTWIKLHLQMVLFGRQFCPARGHERALCPICSKL